jgi:outer membrane protein TolC
MNRIIALLAVFVSVSISEVIVAQESKQLMLDDLIKEAKATNPQLRAARNQISAAKAKINQATAWEPPQVGIEFFQTPTSSFPNPVKNGQETDYFAQQMFPFPGKLSAMGRSAKLASRMTEEDYKALENKIIENLKSTYYELYFAQRKIQINAENQDLMRQFVDIASKQYEVGMVGQADVLRAQTELSMLLNDGINIQRDKKVTEAMLNTILGRPTDGELGYVSEIDLVFPLPTFAQLSQLTLENRPELKSMGYGIEMNKAELSLAKREYFPDLMVRLMYKDMKMGDDNFWAAMFGVNVPLAFWSGRKYTSKVSESRFNVRRAEEEFNSMRNMMLFEVQDALVRVQTSHNIHLLYKNTVIPQAEQTLQSTIAAYQTGKTEFLMLIDAYRTLLSSRLDYYMAVMNYLSSKAELEKAVGLGMDEILEKAR